MPRTSVHTTRIVPATNNEEVLGSNIQLQEAHGSSMRETEDFEKKRKTIKDFCNRLKRMTLWIKDNYPEYYNVGVIQLSNEQKADKRRYHTQEETVAWGSNGKSIHECEQVEAWNREPIYSYEQMRKYHNAIQRWGIQSRPITPPILRVGSGQVSSFFEKKTQAKKDGQLDEHEADPISFSFYSSICEYALLTGAYTVLSMELHGSFHKY